MKIVSKKKIGLFIAILSLSIAWMLYAIFYYTDTDYEVKRFQKEFSVIEKKQNNFKNIFIDLVKTNSTEKLWNNKNLQNSPYQILLYQGDSLIYWNTNQLDFKNNFAGKTSYFVGNLSNGYYLVDKFPIHEYRAYICTKLKNEYAYHNNALDTKTTSYFSTNSDIKIEFSPSESNFPILSKSMEPLFHVSFLKSKTTGKYPQLIIFLLYLIGIIGILLTTTHFLIKKAKTNRWIYIIYPLFLLGIRYFSIQYNWIQLFEEFEIFNPDLYANSSLIPNLGSLLISLSVIFIVVWCFHSFIQFQRKENKLTFLFSYLLILSYAYFINYSIDSLVINSSIPLRINEVFSLSVYSFLALIIIGFLFLSYYFLIRIITEKLVQSTIRLTTLSLFWFFSGILFLIVEFYFFNHNSLLYALWPILLNALFFYFASKNKPINQIKYHILFVIVVSLYASSILFENNQSNERQKRELYANQLITDQDPTMEIEYAETIVELLDSPEFYQLIGGVDYFSAPDFALQIENCCFGEYWERYELDFVFFNEDETPLLEYISDNSHSKKDFIHIIEHHSEPSEIAEGLYFVYDYFQQLSYISHHKLSLSSSQSLDFFILFKSKKIPEQIGFPRLLMNEQSYTLQNLEDYSIARYSKNQLVMQFGSFEYPMKMDIFQDEIDHRPTFVTSNGTNHLIYRQNDGQGVVISKPEVRFIDQLSTFSYLVLFFGIFTVIIILILNNQLLFSIPSLQLSTKIQVVLVVMMTSAFILFTWIAIQNVIQQHNSNTQDSLKEKIISVEKVFEQRIGDRGELNIIIHSDYLNYVLKRLSTVFAADISFYTLSGKLFATSQPKLYEKGISAKTMNNIAFHSMSFLQKSEFIHLERFGTLSFLSGYVPFKNHDGNSLGYINVQHFTKQNVLERQMNDFIVAIINIVILLLVASILLAIIVSNWITTPLRLIQQSFARVEFGKENKPINYKGDDEIGALVKEYNNKLKELELTAMQLAKSERETAWREMAKQIAHEIKNPLTPMKLSVQHFQRTFDPEDSRAKEKLQRIVSSLIEQIDAMTNIANEFSNFAKMPKANEENLDLIPLLHRVADLYSSSEIHIQIDSTGLENAFIFADRELMLRVFNNLVKNSIQAKKENQKVEIKISIEEKETKYLIAVQDNGIGISEELKNKMFVPNFTTKSTGSGLGLAMVKQIVENHNGLIWLESTEEVGTTFYLEFKKRSI